MILSSKREWKALPLGDGSVTYRVAESLDHDVAAQTALRWTREIIKATDTAVDFGLTGKSETELIQEVVNFQSDDLRPWADYLFCVAIALRCVKSIENIQVKADPEDEESSLRDIRVNRADLALILRDQRIKTLFKSKVLTPLYKVSSLGNG